MASDAHLELLHGDIHLIQDETVLLPIPQYISQVSLRYRYFTGNWIATVQHECIHFPIFIVSNPSVIVWDALPLQSPPRHYSLVKYIPLSSVNFIPLVLKTVAKIKDGG